MFFRLSSNAITIRLPKTSCLTYNGGVKKCCDHSSDIGKSSNLSPQTMLNFKQNGVN